MHNEDFADALRSLAAPYFLDGGGRESALGTRYDATTPDGTSVTIVRVHDRIITAMRDVDSFVRTLGSRAHRAAGVGGLPGAGVTPAGGVFVVGTRDDGATLADRLALDGSIPSKDLTGIAINCASLLDDYCVAGVCHGLVMPQTVALVAQDRVELRWGGLFTALRASGLSAAEIGRMLHFSSYLAPELLDGGVENVQSDVFSLGATLYESLTGRPPFGGRTTATIMAAVLADNRENREHSASAVIRTTILRALERDPRDRWRDAAQFRDALVPPVHVTTSPVAGRKGCLVPVVVGGLALVTWSVFR